MTESAERAVSAESASHACPECGESMVEGEFRVHETWLSFLFVGFSYQHLWFKSREGAAKEEIALPCGWVTPGRRCDSCGLVQMKGDLGPGGDPKTLFFGRPKRTRR